MTRAETARLLALCAAFDRRTVGEADVFAWHSVLEDVSFEHGTAAVKAHYADSREWIMPSDIRGYHAPAPEIPVGPACDHGYQHATLCPFCRRASMHVATQEAQ